MLDLFTNPCELEEVVSFSSSWLPVCWTMRPRRCPATIN